MYIGIDLGTSGVKAILLNEQGDVLATHTEKLTVLRPHPLWSEQEPEQWWQATDRAVKGLGRQQSLSGVRALGIAGQCMARHCLIAVSRFCDQRFYGMTDAVAKSAPGWKNRCRSRVR